MLQRFQFSASIVGGAVGLAVLVAVPAGLVAGWRQNRGIDFAIVTTATLLLSIPSFWLGLLMLLVFGIQLGWLPVVGYVGFAEDFWRAIEIGRASCRERVCQYV